MKKIIFSILAITLLLTLQSCDIDNFDMPSATLMGSLIDSETGENVPSQYQNGARIRLYEFYNNEWSNQPVNFYTKQDGTFTNNAVFSGKYKLRVEGPFLKVDEIELDITGSKELDIKVTPYLRVTSSATAKSNSVEVSANIVRVVDNLPLKAVEFYYSKTPYVDRNTFAGKKVVDLSTLTEAQLTSATLTNLTKEFTELTKGETYYFRAGALAENSGNYYNYSEVIEVQFP